MTTATAAPTSAERLAAYRSNHRITLTGNAYTGGERCLIDGIRVHRNRDGRWRHDHDEIVALMDAEYGGPWGFPRQPIPFNLDDLHPEDQHGTPCRRAGHVDGCMGMAGGDHELLSGWMSYDDGEGNLIEVEVS